MIYYCGHGFGDALRIAAVMHQRGVTAITVEHPSPAADVFAALPWVTDITHVPLWATVNEPVEYWESVCCPEALCKTGRTPADVVNLPLTLPYDTRSTYQAFPIWPYTALQPCSTMYKHRVLAPFELPRAVILGTEAERSLVDWPGIPWTESEQIPEPWMCTHDVRGRTTVNEAMNFVGFANAVIGVESWAAILGALWSKPVVQYIDARADRDLKPHWMAMFPTMGFRVH